MDASRFIARKLSFQGKLATAAVAVSFLVMMVAVAVSQGFRESVRDGAARMTGDLRIQPRAMQEAETTPMHRNPKGLEQIMELPGVKAVSPVAARAGIVKNGDLIHGVMIKGVERADSALHVSIPGRLSKILGVGVGDRLTTWFVGESLKARNFTVSEIHSDLLELDDNLLVYARLEDIQRLNGWDPDEVSCLEISVDRALRSRAALDRLADEAGACLMAAGEEDLLLTSAPRSYPQVFDWLGLLDYNVLIILVLMTVVAAFNMISGLLILLLKSIPAIGTLKTMGMRDSAIGKVFLRLGSAVVLKGLVIGNVLAIIFCLVQDKTHLIPLDPANYFVSWVPVHLNWGWMLLADIAAYAVILLLLWLPTRLIARIDPALTVKAD